MLCYQVIQTLSGCEFSFSSYSLQRVLHIIQESSRDAPELGELARNKQRMHPWESEGMVLCWEESSLFLDGMYEACISRMLKETCSKRGFEGKKLAVRVPCASQYLLLWATKTCVALRREP